MGRSITSITVTYIAATRDPRKYLAPHFMNTLHPMAIAFKEHLSQLGYSKSSVGMYAKAVDELFCIYPKKPSRISKSDILAFRKHLSQRPSQVREGGLSEQYIAHLITGLRIFFAWRVQLGKLKADPTSTITLPQPRNPPRAILSQQEIKTLYQNCNTAMERAMLTVFYSCGLRRTEGQNLDLADIHFRSQLLYVRKGKFGHRREIPFTKQAKFDLWEYVATERNAAVNETAFFCNGRGRRKMGEGHNRSLKALLLRAGIEQPVTLHGLRHSIATHLLENGLPVNEVRKFLGHKSLETTQLYTRIQDRQLWNL